MTILAATHAALAATPTPLSRPGGPGAPVALVVPSPGVSAAHYQGLGEALAAAGFEAQLLPAPPTGLAPAAAAAALRAQPPPALVVGHALGGLGVLDALADTPGGAPPWRPGAVALLGVPLALGETPLQAWLLDQEVPPGGVDLGLPRLQEAHWSGHPVLPLLLGTAPAPAAAVFDQRIGAAVLHALQARHAAGWSAPLAGLALPLWVGLGAADELAPVEALPPLPETASWLRFGMLRGWTTDATATDLLADPRPASALARWAAAQAPAPGDRP